MSSLSKESRAMGSCSAERKVTNKGLYHGAQETTRWSSNIVKARNMENLGYVFSSPRRTGKMTRLHCAMLQEELNRGGTIFMPVLNGKCSGIWRNLKCRVQVVYDDHRGDRLHLHYDRWGEPIGIDWERSRPAPSISGVRLLPFCLADELKDGEYYLGIKVVN